MRIRRLVSALLAVAAAGSVLVITEAPAQAARRVCTSYTESLAYESGGVRFWIRRPSVGWNTWDLNCSLQVGDYAPGAIRALQAAIRCSDGGLVAIDGVFGSQTRQGVVNVQTNRSVKVDGVYGPQTRGVMTFAIFKDNGIFADCNTYWG